MNPEFIDWLADMRPSQWCMYGNAYGYETYMVSINNKKIFDQYSDDSPQIKPGVIKELGKTKAIQTFQDFLMECFSREHGEKIQGEDNGN